MHGRDGDGPETSDGFSRPLTDGGADADEEERTADDGTSGRDETAASAAGGRRLPISRRQALAGGGVLVLLGLGAASANVLQPAKAVPPEVPAEELQENGWVLVDEAEEAVLEDSIGPIAVEAVASSVRYEDRGLVEDIRNREAQISYLGETRTERIGDYASGQFDQSMGVFVASKIDVTPHIDELPAGIGRAQLMGQVEAQARSQFEDQLREAGLEDVREVEAAATFEPDSGASAAFAGYRGAFAVEETSLEVEDVPVSIPGASIEIAGHLAVWHDGQNVVVAAGAHPNENYTDTITDTAAGEQVTIDVDLGLRPAQLREEVLGYMAQVE